MIEEAASSVAIGQKIATIARCHKPDATSTTNAETFQ